MLLRMVCEGGVGDVGSRPGDLDTRNGNEMDVCTCFLLLLLL